MNDVIKCSKCKIIKDCIEFVRNHPNARRKYHSWCKSCNSEDARARRSANIEKYRDYQREYYRKNKEYIINRQYSVIKKNRIGVNLVRVKSNIKIKLIVMKHYGSICACCAEDNIRFLTIDHIDGNGTNHRKETGSGVQFYWWLKKNNFPQGYQVLCFNCNCGRQINSENNRMCPHKTDYEWILGISEGLLY